MEDKHMFKNLKLIIRLYFGMHLLFGENSRIWLDTPNVDLDNLTPLDLIGQGDGEIVAELIEDALLGHPG